MWWLRRIATDPTPNSSARSQASASARAVTQMPGRRRASQHAEAPREAITSGSPSTAISPDSTSSTYSARSASPWVSCP